MRFLEFRITDMITEHQKAIEVHIYTWMDSTLSDLQLLIKKALHPGEMEDTITFYRSFKTPEDVLVKKIGIVSASSSSSSASAFSQSESKTLHSVSFSPGDDIFITMG